MLSMKMRGEEIFYILHESRMLSFFFQYEVGRISSIGRKYIGRRSIGEKYIGRNNIGRKKRDMPRISIMKHQESMIRKGWNPDFLR